MAPPVADYVPMFKAPPQTKINLGRMLFHPSSTLQTLVEFMPNQRLTKTLCIFTSFFTFKKTVTSKIKRYRRWNSGLIQTYKQTGGKSKRKNMAHTQELEDMINVDTKEFDFQQPATGVWIYSC